MSQTHGGKSPDHLPHESNRMKSPADITDYTYFYNNFPISYYSLKLKKALKTNKVLFKNPSNLEAAMAKVTSGTKVSGTMSRSCLAFLTHHKH